MLSMSYKTVNSAKAMRDTSNLNKWVFKRVQYAKSATSWEKSLIIENKQPQLIIKQGTTGQTVDQAKLYGIIIVLHEPNKKCVKIAMYAQ